VALRREPRTSTRDTRALHRRARGKLSLENPLSARAEPFPCQHLLNQPGEHGFVQRREPHQTCIQRSRFASDMASRSTPGVASGERTLCSHLSRISAARGSETARSLRPRSISASEGGSRLPRVARRAGVTPRESPRLAGVPPPCGLGVVPAHQVGRKRVFLQQITLTAH
jgi:hypothetical protein